MEAHVLEMYVSVQLVIVVHPVNQVVQVNVLINSYHLCKLQYNYVIFTDSSANVLTPDEMAGLSVGVILLAIIVIVLVVIAVAIVLIYFK